MTPMKWISITLAAGALAVAGCGTATDQSFTRDFNAAQEPLERLLADAGGTQDTEKMGRLADGLKNTANRMRELDPPADAKDELAAFVEEVDASADVMRDVQMAVRGGKPERMSEALTDLQARMGRVATAQQALASAVNE